MIKCLNCSEPLRLLIDLKNNEFRCKSCNNKHSISIKDKTITIESKGKKIEFYLNNISFCNSHLSNKTVYELYNKGYVKCIKTLNPSFNDHYNRWEMQLEEVKESVLKNYKNSIESLNNKLRVVQNSEEKYSCTKCGKVYSFNNAVKENFSCSICSKLLKPYNSEEEIKSINSNINVLRDKLLLLQTGWC
jgi:transcription initiation factor IIE alpha subunit